MSIQISAVILAGGKSSRMKQDKTLMKFGNAASMTQYLYNKLSKIFDKVYISSKENKFGFLDSKESLIFDASDTYSPMAALESIFNTLNQEKVFIISADIPLIKESSIKRLLETSRNADYEIVVAKDEEGNRHNLCGVFNRSIKPKIKKCIKDDIHKINYLINSCSYKEVLFSDAEEFININTKDQYDLAKTLLKKQE